MKKRALVTGISGQDGSYLAEFLLQRGYEVHGILRRSSSINTARLDGIYQDPQVPNRDLFLHYGDVTDFASLTSLVAKIMPHEIYNLAAQSHVQVSFESPIYTSQTDATGALALLEVVRQLSPSSRIYQASSSEMFGSSPPPQNESSEMHPRSPYAASKLFAHNLVKIYREAYGIFAVSGILFNHESPRRGDTFVTKKISKGIAEILRGTRKTLYLGNLSASRDWGYAPDYVVGMWMMLQQDKPSDYVLGTGHGMTVKRYLEATLDLAGLDMSCVELDSRYERPLEVLELLADATKARAELAWYPSVTAEHLVEVLFRYEHEKISGKSHDRQISEIWADAIS